MKRLKAQINGEESTNDEGNSDIQCGQDSDDQNRKNNEPCLKTQLLEGIRICREIRRNKQASEKEELKDYYKEEGELSNLKEEMTNVNHFEGSEFLKKTESERGPTRPLQRATQSSWTTMNRLLTAP